MEGGASEIGIRGKLVCLEAPLRHTVCFVPQLRRAELLREQSRKEKAKEVSTWQQRLQDALKDASSYRQKV